ncbi:MAG: recombinase [Neisseria sp.]|nr:MAG: recombinase [Neisseria sp.]
MKTLIEKLEKIQSELNAPKDAFNAFGKYYYRSAESILKAIKPLLAETGLVLTVSDDIIAVSDRIYVKATAKITDGEHTVETSALAREPLIKKGMDDSQITGAASSYARKYALCGLLAIDDNKDVDALPPEDKRSQSKPLDLKAYQEAVEQAETFDDLKKYFAAAYKKASEEQKAKVKDIYENRKADFQNNQQEQEQ